MNRFSSMLVHIEKKINLPHPEKSRILIEISGDINDLFQVYLEKGLSESEAQKRTEEKFNIDDQSICQLVAIHQSAVNKWMDKFSSQVQKRWERLLFILLMIFIFIISGREILSTNFFLQSSVFILPAFILLFGSAGIFIWKIYHLFFKKDHHLKKIRKGLPTLVFLGCGSLVISGTGFLTEMYFMVFKMSQDMELALLYFTDWLIKCSSMLLFGLVGFIVIALLWYILIKKIQSIEYAETAYLCNLTEG